MLQDNPTYNEPRKKISYDVEGISTERLDDQKMHTKVKSGFRLTTDTLADITMSMAEHQELHDPILTMNLVDHYRVYLNDYVQEDVCVIPLVDFESFITNQNLLDKIATRIALETGDQVTAPKALNPLRKQRSE